MLGLGLGPVRVVRAVTDVQVRGAALPAGGVVRAGAGRPGAARTTRRSEGPPSASQVTTRRSRAELHRRQQPLPGTVGQHLRMPPVRPGRRERVGLHRRVRMPQERRRRSARDGNRLPVERLAELAVEPKRGLMQVEALQAGRRGRQRRRAVRALPTAATARPAASGPRRRAYPYSVPDPAAPPARRPGTRAPATADGPPTSTRRSAASPIRRAHAETGRPPPCSPRPASTIVHDRQPPSLDPLHPQVADHHSSCHASSFAPT